MFNPIYILQNIGRRNYGVMMLCAFVSDQLTQGVYLIILLHPVISFVEVSG